MGRHIQRQERLGWSSQSLRHQAKDRSHESVKSTGRNSKKTTDHFLPLHCAIGHEKCEVLITREADSTRLNIFSVRECFHNGGLFFRRDLRGSSKLSEIAGMHKRQCTEKPGDAAQTPPCRPKIAALAILPVPTRLLST